MTDHMIFCKKGSQGEGVAVCVGTKGASDPNARVSDRQSDLSRHCCLLQRSLPSFRGTMAGRPKSELASRHGEAARRKGCCLRRRRSVGIYRGANREISRDRNRSLEKSRWSHRLSDGRSHGRKPVQSLHQIRSDQERESNWSKLSLQQSLKS